MNKEILAVASYEKKKYFIEPKFGALPEEIQKELKILCVFTAEKLHCDFLIGFQKEGEIYFQIMEKEIDFDDIGAELEIKKIQSEKQEFLKALKIWYVIYFTEKGKKIRQQL